jgi:hypothetical protein
MICPRCTECNFYPCICGKRQYVDIEDDDIPKTLETEEDRLQRQLDCLDERLKTQCEESS